MSMFGEGLIIKLDGLGTTGSAIFNVEIPCADTWYVWARALDYFNMDSSLVQIDGAPEPAAIFSTNCQNGQSQAVWSWRRLNQADPGNVCNYLVDPWTADWDAGAHAIKFSYRESDSLSRMFVTNDPNYVPGDMD